MLINPRPKEPMPLIAMPTAAIAIHEGVVTDRPFPKKALETRLIGAVIAAECPYAPPEMAVIMRSPIRASPLKVIKHL